ncbi:MAG TPA: MFS transporter [Gaiellaceae bacterium]|nr:MFS transporter [Gaiellaceae bacterium]
MRRLADYVRSLNPDLPRSVWVLQAGGLANFFGNGIVIPFLIIYLHNVRGLSLATAGLVAATNAMAALVSGPLAGTLTDRIGPRRTLVGSLTVMAVAISLFPLIHEAWHAFALNALLGFGSGAFWPSQSALVTGLTPPDRRHAAFAQQRVTMNLGFGLGGLTGGLIASTGSPESFTILFLLDAATFLAFAVILSRVPSPARQGHDEVPGTYRDVVRNRPFMSFAALNMLFVMVGIVPLSEFLPVFVKNNAGISEDAIGVVFLVNTLTIVALQLPISKLQEGRRRMAALAVMGVLWAASWLAVLVTGAWLDQGAALAALLAVAVVFAIGECLHGTVQGPVVVDLAQPQLIGRYMAVSSLSWQVAFILGPAVGGAILGAEPLALWPLAATLALVGSAWALALEPRLPRAARRTPARPLVRPEPAGVEAAPAPGMATRPSG